MWTGRKPVRRSRSSCSSSSGRSVGRSSGRGSRAAALPLAVQLRRCCLLVCLRAGACAWCRLCLLPSGLSALCSATWDAKELSNSPWWLPRRMVGYNRAAPAVCRRLCTSIGLRHSREKLEDQGKCVSLMAMYVLET
jgi:hypothetical protein